MAEPAFPPDAHLTTPDDCLRRVIFCLLRRRKNTLQFATVLYIPGVQIVQSPAPVSVRIAGASGPDNANEYSPSIVLAAGKQACQHLRIIAPTYPKDARRFWGQRIGQSPPFARFARSAGTAGTNTRQRHTRSFLAVRFRQNSISPVGARMTVSKNARRPTNKDST